MTQTYHRFLVGWCWFMIAFGAAAVLSAWPPLDAPIRLFIDLCFWPLDGLPGRAGKEMAFATGLAGAILIGWSVTILGLVRHDPAMRETWIWQLLQKALFIWYVPDSLVSWWTGAYPNVLSNTVILASFLWAVAKARSSPNAALQARDASAQF